MCNTVYPILMEDTVEDSPTGKLSGFALHSFIPLDEFKVLLSVDDREDALSRYCLTTATYTIEQHCMRRLLIKKHHERLEYWGDYIFVLRSYPVREVLGVLEEGRRLSDSEGLGNRILPDLYLTVPDCGIDNDIPFCLSVSPGLRLIRGVSAIRVQYWAGYTPGEVPADLASACLELAAWNMSRYRGRRIGMTGNVRGNVKEGEHLETSMPENVRGLLEPYRRKVI
jgi:uncharacterized phiE125 gp8 family phage protein